MDKAGPDLASCCWRYAHRDLKVVVFGKVHAEVPRHNVVIAQVGVNHDATHVVERCWYAPGGVTQMAARLGATGAKLAHHAGQPLGPVAGSEGSPGSG